jgi:signal transduction histidine kinase
MAANMAHEIRNPLNGIRLTMQMLKSRLGTGAVRPEDLDLVIGEVDRLNALLGELLAFREARTPSLAYQKVLPIIERSVELLQSQACERGVEMRVHADDPDARAMVDAKQLAQVLTNLLLNGLHAVSERGRIEINLTRRIEELSIDVRDNGPGVSPESKEHLFEPFYTTRADGVGLGLAVSRELVSGMGGTLDYRDGSSSTDKAGAIFCIRLPTEERPL